MYHSLVGIIGAGAVFMLAPGASAQNIFVSDYQTGDIYEYNSAGQSSVFATGFENPSGIAFDSAGDLFVTDEGRGNIYEFINNNGILSSTATLYATGFGTPASLAFNSVGDLFICDASVANDIVELTTGKVRTTFVGNLSAPWGEAFNSAGDLFVGNNGNGTVTEITPTGAESTFATGLPGPGIGLVFNNAGDLFTDNVNGYGPGSITEITPKGAQSSFVSGIGTPDAMAFNSAGDLLVAQGRSDNLLEFSSTGTLLQTITISGAVDLNGLAIQPVPEPKLIIVLALGGATFVVANSLKKHKPLSAGIGPK